jgi:NDP-sugar pyrophosphorylase family protein
MTEGAVHGIVIAGVYPVGRSALDALVPRPLLPVAQQPLITYALRWMKEGGAARATICTNNASRPIRERLDAAALEIAVDYVEDWNPRGAAGCVRDAGLRTRAGTFLVADGTAVPVEDCTELLAAHQSSGALLTVVVGADATGRLAPTGVYVFDRRALDFIPPDGFQDIKERLIPRLYENGEQVGTYVARAIAPRVVTTESYLALDHWAVERVARNPEMPPGFRSSDESVVHDTAWIDPSARLLGPVLLGPDVSVQAGATLVGPLSVGSRSTIGAGAVVSRSVVWNGCAVGAGALVDRCMLADGVQVEPRQPVFGAVKFAAHRPSRASSPLSVFWDPLSALRPVSHEH